MPNSNPDKRPKITVAKARRMLGMIAKNYSDQELEEIIACLRSISELAYRDISSQ